MKFNSALAIILTLAAAVASAAEPAPYPSRPIRLVVPQPPGGGTDLLARTTGQRVAENLKTGVVIDNRAGGGGTIGVGMVANALPDGFTIVMGFMGPISVNVNLMKLPYDPVRDLAAITLVATTPSALVVHSNLPARSVKELISLLQAKPGHYFYGSAGNGSTPHLAAEMFKLATGTDMVHVPYKGSGPALVDLLAGNFAIYFPSLPAVLPHVKSGKIVALAVTGSKRSGLAPNLPPLAEAGLPGFILEQWYGILTPAKTPDAIARQLHKAFVRALRQSDLASTLEASGFEIVGNSPSEFAAYIREDVSRWKKVVKAASIRID